MEAISVITRQQYQSWIRSRKIRRTKAQIQANVSLSSLYSQADLRYSEELMNEEYEYEEQYDPSYLLNNYFNNDRENTEDRPYWSLYQLNNYLDADRLEYLEDSDYEDPYDPSYLLNNYFEDQNAYIVNPDEWSGEILNIYQGQPLDDLLGVNPLRIPNDLINWQERVLQLDASPIYKQIEWLKEKVNESREWFYSDRKEAIDTLNRERNEKLNELNEAFNDTNLSNPILRKLYLSEQRRINREFDDLINTQINVRFPETNDFVKFLQPFFGEFFFTCYGLKKTECLLPGDIIMTFTIHYKESEKVNGKIVWHEKSNSITYGSKDKYEFFYYMISASLGYMCYNDKTIQKNSENPDKRFNYDKNIIYLHGIQKHIVTKFEIKVIRDLNAKGGYFPYYIKQSEKYDIKIGRKKVSIPFETILLFASYYQIYVKGVVSLNNDIRKIPCLYYSIDRYTKGTINKKTLRYLLSCGQFIRTSSLQEICSVLDIELRIYKPNNNGKYAPYNPGGRTIVCLGLYKSHFFSYEKVPSLEQHNIFSILEGLEKGGYLEEIPTNHRMEIDSTYKIEYPQKFEDREKYKGELHNNPKYDKTRPYKFKKDGDKEVVNRELMRTFNNLCKKEVLFELREELESFELSINDKPSGYSNDIYVSTKERWFNKYDKVVAFDVETYTEEGKLHFLLAAIRYTTTAEIMNEKYPRIKGEIITDKQDIGKTFKNLGGNLLVYIHNLKFDINFLYSMCNDFRFRMVQFIEKSGNIYSVTFRYYSFAKTKTRTVDDEKITERHEMSDDEVKDFLTFNGLDMSYFFKDCNDKNYSETPESIDEANNTKKCLEEKPIRVRNNKVDKETKESILRLIRGEEDIHENNEEQEDESEISDNNEEEKVIEEESEDETKKPKKKAKPRPKTRDGYYVTRKYNEIKFVDSLKIITMSLSEFNSSFNLGEDYKEYCHYEFYNKEINRSSDLLISAEDYVKKPKDIGEAIKSITHVGLDPESFNPLEYLKLYCVADCEVLLKGLLAFRGYLLEAFDDLVNYFNVPLPIRAKLLNLKPTLELFDYLTISSVAHEILIDLGCYTDVMPLRGGNREFMMRCLIGGRCTCVTYKKGRIINKPVVALDAVSLYPSAMSICPGIPTKHGKITEDVTLMNSIIRKSRDNSVFFGVRCKIKHIEKRAYSLPAFNYKKVWMHGMKELIGKEMYMDSITYNDYVKLYGIRIEPIEMIYWDSFNTKINEVIIQLFNVRLKYKEQGKKQLSDVIKRLLNSCYGKTIMKVSDSKWYIGNKNNRDDLIREVIQLSDSNEEFPTIMVKKIVPTFTENNFAHFGVMVLSMSKTIMNEVLRLAKYGSIFYQDTDSYHILKSEVEPLSKIFEKVIKRELQGKNLCQLHIDYDCKGRNLDNIVSEISIYVCPKGYLEMLVDVADPSFKEPFFRFKGIPAESIISYCEKNNISILDLYISGESVKFDMLEGVADINIKGWGTIVTYLNGFFREVNMNPFDDLKKYWKKVYGVLTDEEFAAKCELINEVLEFDDVFHTTLGDRMFD